jgi:hypothetical protein
MKLIKFFKLLIALFKAHYYKIIIDYGTKRMQKDFATLSTPRKMYVEIYKLEGGSVYELFTRVGEGLNSYLACIRVFPIDNCIGYFEGSEFYINGIYYGRAI